MNNLYDILEVCLQDVENGVDLETVLARYPEQAVELRPILQASLDAKKMAVSEPSADVVRRNRAKLLQHAAQLRETQPTPAKRWFPAFQRLAVALGMLLLFFVSGTSLVRAASSALPGDSLYSVKRSWEDVTLFFAFNAEEHKSLEIEFENERLKEINSLFTSGRSAKVDFAGIVTRQNGDGWRIANILVIVSEQTEFPAQQVDVGAAVRVTGTTNGNGVVYAEKIELLPAGAPLPEVEVEDTPEEIEVAETPQATSQPENENSAPESSAEAPEIEVTLTPSPVSTPKIEFFEGILNSISKDVWTVNAILVNVANAEIKGVPVIGARAKVEGYYRPDGVFVAIKIEIITNGSSNDNLNSNNNNDDGSTNSNDNSNDNDDTDTNDNTDDNNSNDNDDNDNNDDNNNNGG